MRFAETASQNFFVQGFEMASVANSLPAMGAQCVSFDVPCKRELKLQTPFQQWELNAYLIYE